MTQITSSLVTAALMIAMLRIGAVLTAGGTDAAIDQRAGSCRPLPWATLGLLAVAGTGVCVQAVWGGAMAAFDHDPARAGWWRPLTATFLQSGVSGAVWNLMTLALTVAFVERYAGGVLAVVLFSAGALLPEHLPLPGGTADALDPRNFIGSSGATYFLAATLTAAAALRAASVRIRLVAVLVPVAGLLSWLIEQNAHGLVVTEGFVLGLLVWIVAPRPSPAALREPEASVLSGWVAPRSRGRSHRLGPLVDWNRPR